MQHRRPTLHLPALVLSVAAALGHPAEAQQELKHLDAIGASAFDRAGFSVDLLGTRALLGAPYADDAGTDAGAVHVFKKSGSNWFHTAEIVASGGAAGDELGFSVATDGFAVVAGAPKATVSGLAEAGRVYVFTEAIGGYIKVEVEPNDPQDFAGFGWSVAYDGTRLVVGAPFADSGGAVYVFEQGFFGWVQSEKIPSSGSPFGRFGWSVALDGDRIVVGAPRSDAFGVADSGEAFAYLKTPLGWLDYATLFAPAPEADASFGYSVAISGTDVLIGSPFAHSGGVSTGVADVFTPSPPFLLLDHEERLISASLHGGSQLGWSVALADGWAAVGAPGHDGLGGSGGAGFVFSREAGGWVESCRLEAALPTQVLGAAIALDGQTAIVGDQLFDSFLPDVGAAFLFDVDPVQGYGCTALNPPGSLVELAGAPAVGQLWQLGVHNPAGTQLPGSMAFLGISGQPPAGFPCGAAVPGWGMTGAGAAGELLLATMPQPVQAGPSTWDGANPAPLTLALPNNPALVGLGLYLQGVMIGSAGSPVPIGLTEALRASVGVAVP
jgi:hypothetical protein